MTRSARLALGLVVLALFAITLVAAYRWAAPDMPYRADFTLTDLNGVEHRSADYDGQVVVLNFWATWCAPCRKEIPMLVDAQKRWGGRGGQGLQIIGVAIDDAEPSAAFATRYGINYPIMAAPTEGARLQDRYTREGTPAGVLPYTAIIDRDGRVSARIAGALSHDQFEDLIGPLLDTQ